MDNQINVEGKNIQQIGQNPVNQPAIIQEKQKVNNRKILPTILLALLLFGIAGLYFLTIKSQKDPLSDRGLLPPPTQLLREREFISYSVEELRKSVKISSKMEVTLDEEAVLRDIQKNVKSFPGFHYDRMEFTLEIPYFSQDEGYTVGVRGKGYIEEGSDYYSFSYNLKNEQLKRTSFDVLRTAVPASVQNDILNRVQEEESFKRFSVKNQDTKAQFILYTKDDPRPNWKPLTLSDNFISVRIVKPCGGWGGYDCYNDQYSVYYDIKDDRLKRTECSGKCQTGCGGSHFVEDYGFTCSVGYVCCVYAPQ